MANHPDGKKTGKLSLPEIAKRSKDILDGFICGLFSVEGSAKTNRYVRLTLEMLEPRLIQEISSYFDSLGLRPHTYKYRKGEKMMQGVYLYGPKDITFYLRHVGIIGHNERKLVSFLSALNSTENGPEEARWKGKPYRL